MISMDRKHDAKKQNKRKSYLDFIKIIAILLVIFNHTGESGFIHFISATESIYYWPWLFASIACKIAVPLFFMASGAVLLGRDESLSFLYTHRILRFSIVLVFFTTFQYLLKSETIGFDVSFKEILNQILSGKETLTRNTHPVAYWYLYAYLSMLMFLPFLRTLSHSLKNSLYWYLIILSVIFTGLLPITVCFLNQGRYAPVDILGYTSFLSWWILYPLLGYFLDTKLQIQWWTYKKIIIFFLLSLACISLTLWITRYHLLEQPATSEGGVQTFHTALILIPSCFFFVAAKKLFDDIFLHDFIIKSLVWFGGLSFSVMLLENCSRKIIRDQLDKWQMQNGIIYCTILVLGAYLIAAVLGTILKFIPGIKKLL